jgi:hypothetical protein
VCAEPAAAKIFRESFCNLCHGQSARIRGDDGSVPPHSFHALQQVTLDLEVLDDGFYDPIDIAEFFQIIFEVPDRD